MDWSQHGPSSGRPRVWETASLGDCESGRLRVWNTDQERIMGVQTDSHVQFGKKKTMRMRTEKEDSRAKKKIGSSPVTSRPKEGEGGVGNPSLHRATLHI